LSRLVAPTGTKRCADLLSRLVTPTGTKVIILSRLESLPKTNTGQSIHQFYLSPPLSSSPLTLSSSFPHVFFQTQPPISLPPSDSLLPPRRGQGPVSRHRRTDGEPGRDGRGRSPVTHRRRTTRGGATKCGRGPASLDRARAGAGARRPASSRSCCAAGEPGGDGHRRRREQRRHSSAHDRRGRGSARRDCPASRRRRGQAQRAAASRGPARPALAGSGGRRGRRPATPGGGLARLSFFFFFFQICIYGWD